MRSWRNIVGIFKADDAQGQNRHKGYVKALQEAGILYDPDKVVWFYTEDRTIQPYQQVREMARRRQEDYFDAIVCYNDQIAIEAIRALQEEGLSVPGDVLVTGFDNSYLAVNGRVPLTTIEHPKEKLGEMAARMLLELIEERKNGGKPEKDELSSRTIVIPPKLIVRESARRGTSVAYGSLTKEQFDAEIEKGMEDIRAGRVHSADEVEAEMKREFVI